MTSIEILESFNLREAFYDEKNYNKDIYKNIRVSNLIKIIKLGKCQLIQLNLLNIPLIAIFSNSIILPH